MRGFGRRNRRRDDNNKMDTKEIGWEGEDRIDVEDRDKYQGLVNVVIKLRVPQNAGNFLTT
jgi:hypothetical protein